MTILPGHIFTATFKMVVIECCECNILFAITDEFDDQCRDKPEEKSFYCPVGHKQHYVGDSIEKKLKRQLSNVQSCCDEYQAKVEELKVKNRCMKGGYRAQLKRIKKEVA